MLRFQTDGALLEMAKFQSPLLGYNNNVRYQGRVFHIQTEDSGINHPHIITHLFMDGGRILKSVKTSYAQHVGIDGMSETVRLMMKEQHKAMVVALKEGQYDGLLDGGAKRSADAPATVGHPAPPVPVPMSVPKSVTPAVPVPAPVVASRLASVAHVPASVQVSTERRPRRDEVTHPTPLSIPLSNGEDSLPPELEALLRDDLPPARAPAAPPPPKRPPSVRELTLDFDALERDAGEGSIFRQNTDLPPPPKNLFTREPRTAPYRAAEDGSIRVEVAPSKLPPSVRPPTPAAAADRAPAVGAARTSLFSDNLVSDQSLDEVILSYLAEDLEPPRRK